MARLRLLQPRRPLTAALPQQTSAKPAGVTFGRDRPQPWQLDAWRFYDDLGMIKFYANYRGNALGKVKLYVGVANPDGTAPIPVDNPDADFDPTLAAIAIEELAALRDPVEGQSGILRFLGLNQAVAAECRLLGRDDQGPESWKIYSVEELRRNNDGQWELRSDPYSRTADEILPADSFVTRLWRPHPRRRLLADCSMRGVLADCAALALLEQDIIGTAQSRIAGSGILALKKGLDGRNRSPEDGGDEEPSQFVDDLLEHILAPIRNPGTAAAVAPMVVELALGTGERLGDVMQHITFDRKMDPVLAAQRDEKRKVIAGGLDLPNETILGLGDVNHWTGFLVNDEAWKGHLEPDVLTACAQLTSGYLRPKISARFAALPGDLDPRIREQLDRLVIGYDESEVVNHPNRGQDANDGHDRYVLSDDAWRRYKGFSDTDAPDPAEVAARVEVQRLIHARGAVPGDIPIGDVTAPGEEAPGLPATKPTETPAMPKATTAALVAAGSPRPVAERLLSLDQRLRARVEAAADTATRRALEKAGNRIATKVSKQPALKATVAGVARTHAAAALGRSVVASLDLTDDDLLDGCYDDFADQTDSWVDDTQQSALSVLVADLRRNGVQVATVAATLALLLERGQTPSTSLLLAALAESADGNLSASLRDAAAQIDADYTSGRALLLVGLQDRVRALLYSPDPFAENSGRGEYDGTILAPMGVIRDALNTFGGGRGGMPTSAQAVAAGSRTLGIAKAGGYAVESYEWRHDSPQHPFEPHENLDGTIFTNPEDPRLDAGDDGDWIESQSGGYFPGDHPGCRCDLLPQLVYMPPDQQEAA